MNDEEVEAKLARWNPARPPSVLMQRLHATVAPAPTGRRRRWHTDQWSGGWPWRPWPMAYAGLLTAWALILALRLLTPSDTVSAPPVVAVQINATPDDAQTFTGTLAAERTFLLTRKNLDQL